MASRSGEMAKPTIIPEVATAKPVGAFRSVRPCVRVAAYSVIAILTITLAEGLAYLYLKTMKGYDGSHLLNYEFDDYKNFSLTPGYVNTEGVYHNAQGFRRRDDTPLAKSAGVYRIFLMGGSTAYGLGSLSRYGQAKYPLLRNDETIDYYLQEYLNERTEGHKVEVINAAITSHGSHHHLIYLNQKILRYSPDMVIFIDGFNDYYPYDKGFDQFRDYAYQARAHTFMTETTAETWLSYTGWLMFRKSHFVHVTARALRPVWVQISRMRGATRKRILVEEALTNLRANASANFVKMVERNALILKHEGVEAVFTLQPEIVLEKKKVLTELEHKIYGEMDTEWEENYVEFKNKAHPIVVEMLTKATARTGGAFYDLTEVFEGVKEDAYTDYCHLTPMGNKRVAEYLGDKLLPVIRGDRRPDRRG